MDRAGEHRGTAGPPLEQAAHRGAVNRYASLQVEQVAACIEDRECQVSAIPADPVTVDRLE